MLRKILHKINLYTAAEVKEIKRTNRKTYNEMIGYWKQRALEAEKAFQEKGNSDITTDVVTEESYD